MTDYIEFEDNLKKEIQKRKHELEYWQKTSKKMPKNEIWEETFNKKKNEIQALECLFIELNENNLSEIKLQYKKIIKVNP